MRPRMVMSSEEVGSSSTIRSGSVAMARAMPTRCCWPPLSWCGIAVEIVGLELDATDELADAVVALAAGADADAG